MYESHFHLDQTPFSIAPDPAFLYLSDGHREALAHLMYGFSHGGFVLITGEVGTGKTTLLRNLIKQTPDDLDVAFVLNPRLTVKELLETLCDELGVAYPANTALSVKQYIDALNRHLLATHDAGRGTVVIIDEAQNLTPAVLEQIRLLTNLETDKRKLLRIILIGQPELAALLARNELRQLEQRITARYHLGTLTREDSYAYVVHRLTRAGGNPHLFSRGALRRLYRISKGTPRLINLVADRAMLGAYVEGKQRITAPVVDRAAREVLGRRRPATRWLAAGALAATASGVAWAYFLLPQPVSEPGPGAEPPTPAVADAAQPAVADAPIEPDRNGRPEDAGPPDVAAARPAADPSSEVPAEPIVPPPSEPAAAAALGRPDMSAYRAQRLAYQAVFERWGVDFDGQTSGIPCNFAPSAGLQCLSRTGSWSDIRRINLPVVLELWDDAASPYYGAVTATDGDLLVLQIGEELHRVSPAALRDIWFGSYVVLWQMPPDYHGTLKRGDRHPSVRWLRGQLESLGDGPIPAPEPRLFDAELQDAVMRFQQQEELLADGIVGPETWIRLGERIALPGPKLEG